MQHNNDTIPFIATGKRTLTLAPVDLGMAAICIVCIAKIALHLVANQNYGFHREELLYLAQGRQLDWGFMECPPLVVAWCFLGQTFIGDSLVGLRMLPMLTGVSTILLVGCITRELRGDPFAQFLACSCALFAPGFLVFGTLIQPNCLDLAFWSLAWYLLIRLLRTGDQSLIVKIGLVTGMGMLAKYTFGFWVAGIALAMLIHAKSNHRFRRKSVFIAIWCATLLLLPNIVWQVSHRLPIVNHMQGLYEHELTESTMEFIIAQPILLLPPTYLLSIVGLIFYLRRENVAFRIVGYSCVIIFMLLLLTHGKSYYLMPCYPPLMSSGSVVMARFLNSGARKLAFTGFVFGTGMIALPFFTPVLPIQSFQGYLHWLTSFLRQTPAHDTKLPEYYADMMGWRERTDAVAYVYATLPEQDKANCIIIASNYGQAGGFQFFGEMERKLPKVVCTSGSFFLWPPEGLEGDVAIAVGLDRQRLRTMYRNVNYVTASNHSDAIEERSVPIYLCRQPILPLGAQWQTFERQVFD